VTVPEPSQIRIYAANASGTDGAAVTIKENPTDKPVGVSVDMAGDVFVANENGNVRAFGSPDRKRYQLIRTVEGPNTRLQHPVGIAVDRAGSFFIADAGNGPGQGRVEWFPAGLNGNIQPNRVIEGPHTGISTPRGIAMDASGRTYVTDQANNRVLVFDSDVQGDTPPIAIISGLKSPEAVAVDQLLNVYVTNQGDDSVAVFAASGPETWTRIGDIRNSAMKSPSGVTTDADGRIAVASTGGILFFPPNSNGAVEPTSQLRGSPPMNPSGLCFH
jgi:serine/threonine-protein kinase